MSAGKNKWPRSRRRKLQRLKSRISKGQAADLLREKRKVIKQNRQKLIDKNKG